MNISMANLIRRIKKSREKKEKREEKINAPSKVVVEGEEGFKFRGKAEEKEKAEEEEEKKKKEKEGLEFPKRKIASTKEFEEELEEERGERRSIRRKYPLIPKKPKEGETVFAWAYIYYDEENEELFYRVIEPNLTKKTKEALDKVEDLLKSSVDVDFGELKKEKASDYLTNKVNDIIGSYDFGLNGREKQIIQYYAYRDFIGLGKIEPLMNDTEIEDISCDGANIPIYAYHRDPKIGSVQTNISFEEKEELDSFTMKLAQRCGRSISVADPLLDGALPDGSRVQATLGTDISRRGSNFTIRRFTEEPLTPVHMIDFGTLNAEMLAYFWLAVENGKSALVVGPTAAGKTSLLNAFSLFIRPEMKIVSIEDTPELRLPHPHWIPEVARAGFGFGESKAGEVTLDDLLKESLRQRPDYIIVGEVRGSEAYILFQQIATGHPGMSTLHASSLDKVMDRLTTKPINLPPTLIENLDIIAFIKRVKRRGTYIRRVSDVLELEEYDREEKKPIVNRVFEWNVDSDTFTNVNKSNILAKIAEETGTGKRSIQNELMKRKKVLKWMYDENIRDYKRIGKIASAYYSDPSRILDMVEGM